MLNLECVDKVGPNMFEMCFTDPEGDEAVKICVSESTAWDIVREIREKMSYAANLRQQGK